MKTAKEMFKDYGFDYYDLENYELFYKTLPPTIEDGIPVFHEEFIYFSKTSEDFKSYSRNAKAMCSSEIKDLEISWNLGNIIFTKMKELGWLE